MDTRARLVAAVIHGAAVKDATAPIAAVRTAAQACGSEAHWLGSTEEEKARILSWMEADLSNEKLLIADLEKALESSSFVGVPTRETAADLVVYSALSGKNLGGEAFQKSNPNVTRWMNHMQTLIARLTGNPELTKFKVAGLRAISQEVPAATAAAPPAKSEHADKKEEKKAQKEEKKEEKKVQKEAKKDVKESGDAAALAAPSPAKKEGKEKSKEDKPAKSEEEEPKKKKAAPAPAGDKKEGADGEFLPNLLDVRVGKILSARQLTEKLYIEEIDVGEAEPRTVCSGLVQHYASADMISGKNVLVVCNLKPRKMADSESNGMVLAASSAEGVKLVEPPAGSKPGDHVSYTNAPATPAEFMEPNKVNKKKVLESVMPGWGTDAEGRVIWADKEKNTVHTMMIGDQPVLGGGIKNGTVG